MLLRWRTLYRISVRAVLGPSRRQWFREEGEGIACSVDRWLVVEEDVNVIERSSELVGQYLEFNVLSDHWQDVLLDDHEAFA